VLEAVAQDGADCAVGGKLNPTTIDGAYRLRSCPYSTILRQGPELNDVDIEGRLRQLELHYRAALSASVAAKATYLALVGDPSALPRAVDKAKERWQQLDALKRGIAFEMAELEELEHESTT
jgi:hypothetical protein